MNKPAVRLPIVRELACPRKRSTIAYERCLELQRETFAEGTACTCPVYRAATTPAPRRATVPANRPTGGKKGAHAKGPRRCKQCSEFPAEGTRIKGELCKRCRDDNAEVAAANARGPVDEPALPPDADRQVVAPVIVQHELGELRKEVERYTGMNRRLRARLDLAIRVLRGISRGLGSVITALAEVE